MRGFGVVEPMFACESNMDNLARVLGMDGDELRRINAIQRGDRWIFNQLQDRPTPTHLVMTAAAAMPLPAESGPAIRSIVCKGVESPRANIFGAGSALRPRRRMSASPKARR